MLFIFAFNAWCEVKQTICRNGVVVSYKTKDGETIYPCEVKATCIS